jgi:hypothetical protein
LSSRLSRRAVEPERTRISYIAALSKATYATFRKESRIRGRVQCSVQEIRVERWQS